MSSSTYILFIKNDSPKIVFYLTHENLLKIMQELGLLPITREHFARYIQKKWIRKPKEFSGVLQPNSAWKTADKTIFIVPMT